MTTWEYETIGANLPFDAGDHRELVGAFRLAGTQIAIHPSIGDHAPFEVWTVSHIPSGLAVIRVLPDIAAAQAFAVTLCATCDPAWWEFNSLETAPETLLRLIGPFVRGEIKRLEAARPELQEIRKSARG